MGNITNLVGRRFGRLIVIELYDVDKTRDKRWKCRCDCGSETLVRGSKLRNGRTKSCGCLRKEAKGADLKHGASHTRLYRIYSGMKDRCLSKNDAAYQDYGGRGITICDEWLNSFDAFRDWALSNGYRYDLTIDRIENDGSYSPENCRWTTRKVQANNQRSNHIIEYNGEKKTVAQWSEITGIRHDTLLYRLKRNWPIEKVLFHPVRSCNKR